jgi:site-specific DNA recombinase
MNSDRPKGAVTYLRVSTDEQANSALSLPSQEKTCEAAARAKQLPIIRIFIDPGESARTADRPQFQEMVRFCKVHRHEVGYVIVQNLSRFARNHADQSRFLKELYQAGIQLVSAYEPQVDQTPAGKLAGNIIGAFNQYYSDDLAVRMRDRCRAAVLAGRWPWPAPPGYVNVDAKDGANIVPDAESAPFIRKCFELIATGLHTQSDVLRTMTVAGLRNRRGRLFNAQEFQRILRNPVFAGWLCPPSMPDLRAKGLHQPIVPQELFDKVQEVLDGKKPIATPKRRINPAFSLRGLVRCASCESPLTAAFCRSKTGKRYPYYYCRTRGCRTVKSTQAQALEDQFLSLMNRLQPRPEITAEFSAIAAQVWETQQEESEKSTGKLTARLEEQKRLKSELLRAKLRGEVSQSDYEQGNAEFSREIVDLERQLRVIVAAAANRDAFVRFCELAIVDILAVWRRANEDQRRRVRQILFSEGILVDAERKLSNPRNSSLFNVLERMMGEKPKKSRIGCPPGIRTPITCSRGRCPSR